MAMEDVLAVVLGGGRGARLYPLTKLRTKPAVPIGGKYRLIDVPISNCIHSGITRIFVLTQYLPASLHRHVHQTYRFDVFTEGFVDVLSAEQTLDDSEWYQGTADAVRRQMTRILSRRCQDLLVLAGDHLYRMDYGKFVQYHRESQAAVTVAALPVTAADAPRYGVMKTDRDGRITEFVEKPQEPRILERLVSRPGDEKAFLASMGIYVFSLDVLQDLLEQEAGDDFGQHILPTAIRAMRVFAYPFDGYWEDIGTMGAFYEANLALTRPKPPFDFYDARWPIYTRSRFLPASRIDGCAMERAVVADGCRLYDAEISECVVGLRSMIRPGARLRHVVVMGADFYETGEDKTVNRRLGRPHLGIGRDAQIERAIIDKNARIGRGVRIRSHAGEPDRDLEYCCIRDGIVVIPKNAIVPRDTVI